MRQFIVREVLFQVVDQQPDAEGMVKQIALPVAVGEKLLSGENVCSFLKEWRIKLPGMQGDFDLTNAEYDPQTGLITHKEE